MRSVLTSLAAIGLVGLGYLVGSSGALQPAELAAQAASGGPGAPTKEIVEKVTAAHDAMKVAIEELRRTGRYQAATVGTNAFAVSVGGLDARDDLEKGRGVDPETFAGLYAGLEDEDIRPHIGRDVQGRVTYKKKVVRLYPISRIKALFKERLKYSDESRP